MSREQDSLFGGLENIIESFEEARGSGKTVKIADFLPDRLDVLYEQALQELIRVDLDYRFRSGETISVEDYRDDFPEIFDSPDLLAPLAFEEYRLRLQSPVPVDSSVFARRYGLDTGNWPAPASSQASAPTDSEDALDSGIHASFASGDRLLDFLIVGELGRGAFSRVYLARQSSLAGRLVVLKLSSVRLKEADRLARLQHTNIVPVYSVHDFGRCSVLCMPWFGAATLKDVIESLRDPASAASGEAVLSTVTACDSRTLVALSVSSTDAAPDSQSANRNTPQNSASASRSPLRDLDREQSVLWIGRQMAEGLAHAHSRGILHRDLKPANVLLTEDGQPMILDFNLAVETHSHEREEQIVGGTLPYMSPEQIDSVDSFCQLDSSADLFSLGVILFEMLTGKLPFSSNSGDRRKMIDERRGNTPSARIIRPGISVDADSILQKCLAPEKSNRYQSAEELAEDLSRHLRSEPLRFAKNRSLKERTLKWARRHPRLASGSGVMLICCAVLLLISALWWQSLQMLRLAAARQAFSDLREQMPALHAQMFAAAVGEESRPKTIATLNSALSPFLGADGSAETAVITSDLPTVDQRTLQQHISELQFFRLSLQYPEHSALSSTTNPPEDSEPSQTSADADQYRKAFQLVLQRRLEDARMILKPICERHPERFPAVLLQGMLERIQGSDAEADRLLSVAIALQPDCARAWYQRGVCRYRLRKFQDAVSDFNKVLELDPSLIQAVVSRAMAHLASGKPEKALPDLNTAIAANFPETRVWLIRASVHSALKNSQAAAQDREQALRQTPTDARSWVARGLAQLPEHPERAVADLLQAQRVDPSSHDAFRNLSMVLSEYLKQPDESIEVLTNAMIHHPWDAYLWSGRGVLYARANRREESHQDAVAALQKSQEPMLLYMVACIYALTSEDHPEDGDVALQYLAASLRRDLALTATAASDPDLRAIAGRSEFQDILKAAMALTQPAPSPIRKNPRK